PRSRSVRDRRKRFRWRSRPGSSAWPPPPCEDRPASPTAGLHSHHRHGDTRSPDRARKTPPPRDCPESWCEVSRIGAPWRPCVRQSCLLLRQLGCEQSPARGRFAEDTVTPLDWKPSGIAQVVSTVEIRLPSRRIRQKSRLEVL